jgi:hypothetical protein
LTIVCINKRYYTVPTEWNELSQKQLLQVMECLFIKQYTGEQIVLQLLKILTGMSPFRFFSTRVHDLEEFFYLALFILQEDKALTKQILHVWDGLHGPSDELGNLVMAELVFADAHFMAWAEDKENMELLDQLVAVLYRPVKPGYDLDKDPDGDPREEFNSNLCSWRAVHVIKRWPISVKLAIVTYYAACRWQMVENNDEVFGGDGGDPAKYGLVSVIRQVAKNSVLGDFNKVEKQLVSLVLIELNESIAEAKAQEKAMKR